VHGAREHLSTIFEGVLNGEFPRPDKVKEELGRLDRSFDTLQSPEKHIETGKVEPPPSRAALLDPIKDFTISKAIGDQAEAFGKLNETQQGLLRGLVDTDPGALRKAVVAETKEAFESSVASLKEKLTKQGKQQPEIEAAIKAVEDLNKSWHEQTGKNLPPDHILQLASKIGQLPSQKLRNAVLKSKRLQELAHSNPEMLKAMWEAYEKKGAKYPFDTYVGYIQRQIRGLVGEYALAFDLGDGMILLKGPDAKVTIPGTDAVALNLKTGEVVLLDNKALNSVDPLGKVDALTRNLPQNIAKDAAEFQVKIGTGPETDVQVSSAIKRIQEAAAEIEIEVSKSGLSKDAVARDPVIQGKIQEILRRKNILRQVGNAGGKTPRLTARLEALEISLLDVNAPLAD
jgi:hypothetical protein